MVGRTYTRRTRARDVRRAGTRVHGAHEQANARPGEVQAAAAAGG